MLILIESFCFRLLRTPADLIEQGLPLGVTEAALITRTHIAAKIAKSTSNVNKTDA